MLRRALLAAAAFSYLICVLIMSGMQKEDLDMGLLRKLQRSNVNIDDMNNRQLRRECPVQTNELISATKDKTDIGFLTTVTTEDPSRDLNMATVLNYLKTRQEYFTILVRTTTTEKINLDTHEIGRYSKDNVKDEFKIDVNLLQKYIQPGTTTNVPVNKGEYNTKKIGHSTLNGNNKIKTDERNTYTAEDIKMIEEIFKNDFFHKQTTSITEVITTRHSINIQNEFIEIDEKGSQAGIKRENANETQSDVAAKNNFNNKITSELLQVYKEQNGPNRANPGNESIHDLLNMLKRFKTYPTSPVWYINNSYTEDRQKLLSDTVTESNQKVFKENRSDKFESGMELKHKAFSPMLIREIAESVKEVIIKDLRKELSNTYIKPTVLITTTSTTEPSRITTHKAITQEKEIAIMDKFMELYEQIKALKQSTLIKQPHNRSKNKGNAKQELNSVTIIPSNMFESPVSNFKTKQSINPNQHYPRQTKNRQLPITIQTNSLEIKPLAVPVFKAENVIRQNIIVDLKHNLQSRDKQHPRQISTRYSYTGVSNTHRNKIQKPDLVNPYERYNKAAYNAARNPLQTAYGNPIRNREDVIRLRMTNNGNSRFDADYYEKMSFGNYNNGANENDEGFANSNVPRFHERLEKVDGTVEGKSGKEMIDKREYGADDVTSRQQLSLIEVKKGNSYDDTNFKKFLKSQQKVTSILEKILASRPKINIPGSVEIS